LRVHAGIGLLRARLNQTEGKPKARAESQRRRRSSKFGRGSAAEERPVHTRSPAVAGLFYPADPKRLAAEVAAYLAAARRPDLRSRPG
jgi:hypothetical protein